jgi:hypothetical protein
MIFRLSLENLICYKREQEHIIHFKRVVIYFNEILYTYSVANNFEDSNDQLLNNFQDYTLIWKIFIWNKSFFKEIKKKLSAYL